MDILSVLGIASIPSVCITAFISWRFKVLEKRMDEKEKARAERDYLLVKGTIAL